MAPYHYYPTSNPACKHNLLWKPSMLATFDGRSSSAEDVIETIESLSSSLVQSAMPLPGGKLPSNIARLATIYTYADAPTHPKPLSRSPRIWRLVRKELFDAATRSDGPVGGGGTLRRCDVAVKHPSCIPAGDAKSLNNSEMFSRFLKFLGERDLVAALARDSAGRIGFVVPMSPGGDGGATGGDDGDGCYYAAHLHYAPMVDFLRRAGENREDNSKIRRREKKEGGECGMPQHAPPLEEDGPETRTRQHAPPPAKEKRRTKNGEGGPKARTLGRAPPPGKGRVPPGGRSDQGDAGEGPGKGPPTRPPSAVDTWAAAGGPGGTPLNIPPNDADRKSDLLLVQEAHRELEKCLALVRKGEEERKKPPPSEMLLERGRDVLKHMDTLRIDNSILTKTHTGHLICKFKKHPELGSLAKPLIKKWKAICQTIDKQREKEQKEREARGALGPSQEAALDRYRKRVNELKERGQAKPDMVAFKELRSNYSWLHERRHGQLAGVPIGLKVTGRGEAAILGIHTNILSGMDSIKDEPCYAVCISGGYKDDEASTSGGIIYYTGSGGQRGGRQVEDQRENSDNLSLLRSMDTGDPIRLLRSHGPPDAKPPSYRYMGQYECTDSTYEESVDGPRVYKFRLEPVEGKSVFHLEQSGRRAARPEPTARRSTVGGLGDDNISPSTVRQDASSARSFACSRGQLAQANAAAVRKRKRTSANSVAKNRLNAQMAKHRRS